MPAPAGAEADHPCATLLPADEARCSMAPASHRERSNMPKVVDPISADEVKALRAALGLTHEAFARRLGVSLPTVQHWASGWRRPGHFASMVLREMIEKQRVTDKGPAE